MRRYFATATAMLCTLLPVLVSFAQVEPFGGSLGIDVSGMDRTVRPQDDFFRFVNGRWIDNTEIPADKSRYGSFAMLSDESEIALKEIAEQAAGQKNPSRGSEIEKVGDLYHSFMDTARVEAAGIHPLEPHLAYILKLNTSSDVVSALFRLST